MSIYVIGIGPGSAEMMTPQAFSAIERSEVIVGYDVYIKLLDSIAPNLLKNKKIISAGMKREIIRANQAIEEVRNGKAVAVISSGDSGVYGMAGLIYERAESFPEIDIQVIPGITAALSAAAILGAPIMNDFAVVSLSDLLTPWETIEKRLSAAAKGDFTVALYNPSSNRRKGHLKKAQEILLRDKAPRTPCGLVRNAGREGGSYELCELRELHERSADMFTTVIIGCDTTEIINGKLITRRGYSHEG